MQGTNLERTSIDLERRYGNGVGEVETRELADKTNKSKKNIAENTKCPVLP